MSKLSALSAAPGGIQAGDFIYLVRGDGGSPETGSVAEAAVAATAQTDFDVQKNGVSVATIRFAAAGTSASFINAGADTFAAGDNLKVVAPNSPDATLADIVMTLAFTRS